MLLSLNLPLPGLWRGLSRVPYRLVYPAIVALGAIGLYSVGHSSLVIYLGALSAMVGCVFHKLGCEPVPLLLGFVFGPSLQDNLRRVLQASDGDWSPFITHPVSAGLLLAAALPIVAMLLPSVRARRLAAFAPD
jgi:TctA family transporter